MSVIPSLSGHQWLRNDSDMQRHQYPVNATPDAEGLVDSACGRVAFAARLTGGPDWVTLCPDCLLPAMSADADRVAEHADRAEQQAVAYLRDQQRQLRDGTFDV